MACDPSNSSSRRGRLTVNPVDASPSLAPLTSQKHLCHLPHRTLPFPTCHPDCRLSRLCTLPPPPMVMPLFCPGSSSGTSSRLHGFIHVLMTLSVYLHPPFCSSSPAYPAAFWTPPPGYRQAFQTQPEEIELICCLLTSTPTFPIPVDGTTGH